MSSNCWRSRFQTDADFLLQIRDNTQDPCGRLSFMKEPRNYRALTQNAICNLNITLPSYCKVKVSGREGTGGGGVSFSLTKATFESEHDFPLFTTLTEMVAPQELGSTNRNLYQAIFSFEQQPLHRKWVEQWESRRK